MPRKWQPFARRLITRWAVEPGPNLASIVGVTGLEWVPYARCGRTMGTTTSMYRADGVLDLVGEVDTEAAAHDEIRAEADAPALLPGYQHMPPRGFDSSPRFIIGEREHRLYLLRPQVIERIESYGNYVRLCLAADRYLRRDSLKRLETSLAPLGFIRIRSSLLLNLSVVHYIEKLGCGVLSFALADGRCFKSSATYRSDIVRTLQLAAR
jgi:DNA-binding LytR/AlgR family response regulator